MSRSTFTGKHGYSLIVYIVHTTGCSTDKVGNLLVNGKKMSFDSKHSINNFQQIPSILIFYYITITE